MLYNHYGEQMFKDDADAIIKWSEKNMANSQGLIHVCQTVSGDLCNFKGIMLRYLRMYAESFNDPSHYAWIAKNAYHAWNNRNSSGITSSAWLTKAEENFKHLEGSEYKNFGHDGNMTCVSAAFNCHLGVVLSHDAYAKNEAEDFNFVRNAQVSYTANADEDGGGKVGPMKNNNYIGYRRVDFGDKPASHINLRANITLSSTGINVFLDQPNTANGILLCSVKGIELAGTRTWDTITKMLNQPVTGVHDVYFVSSGSGQTNINWWQFQSLNPVFADLTNGNGSLATSFAAENVSALTDNDLLTAVTADIEAGAETWIEYQTPSPLLLYGYQLFSGSTNAGDPKGWSLQASDDGQTWETLHVVPSAEFSVRGQRYNANVQTTKAYTRYRLIFDMNEAQTQLSISEWQLLGHYICGNDLTADGGTISEGSEPLTDHVGTTSCPTPIAAIYRSNGNYKLTAYSITIDATAVAPTSWKLEGSANGSTGWKLIDQQTEALFPYNGSTNIYLVKPETSYPYYRLTINGEEEAVITQWQLFGEPDFGTYYADVTSICSIVASNGSDASTLIDDDGTTYATISGTNPYWYIETPLPVKVLGYSLVCGNDANLDPQNITLFGYDENGEETQISSKAPTFKTRGSRLTYAATTTKLFKRFKLQAGETNSEGVRLADFELYGAAIAEADETSLLNPSLVEASAVALSNTELISRVHDCSRTTNYRAAFTEPVTITYTFDQPVSINTYSITASKNEPTRDPAGWVLEATNTTLTGTDEWTLLDSRSGETFSNRYATQFYKTNSTNEGLAFNVYRLTIDATNGGNQLQIGELQLLNLEYVEISDPTGIQEATNAGEPMADGWWYDLSGRRISDKKALRPGIYIQNGKKRLINK